MCYLLHLIITDSCDKMATAQVDKCDILEDSGDFSQDDDVFGNSTDHTKSNGSKKVKLI